MGLLPLEFTDGLTDSPYFRETLQAHERELDLTNTAIKHLIKDIKDLIAAARNLSRAQRTLSETLNNFNFECIGNSQTDDEMVISNSFKDFARLLSTIEDERDRLLEKADEAFLEPIERFRRDQIGSAKEAKKKFEKETAKYCHNLERYLNLSVKKSETQLWEADANNSMEQQHFFKAMSEYVLKLQEVNERKKFEFVETVLSFMLGWLTFYHQGHEIATDFYSVKMELQMRLQRTRNNFNMTQEETKSLRKKMLNNQEKFKQKFQDSCSFNNIYTRQGYLFLMEKKAFTTSWTKHFCKYEKNSRRLTMIQYTQTMGKIISTEDIIVKKCIKRSQDTIDRRFCFDIITYPEDKLSNTDNLNSGQNSNTTTNCAVKNMNNLPNSSSNGNTTSSIIYTFQALSEKDYKYWLETLDACDPYPNSTNLKVTKQTSKTQNDNLKNPSSADGSYSNFQNDLYYLDAEGYWFVKKCIESIEARGLDHKGIYRVVGVTSRVRTLMETFIQTKSNNYNNCNNGNDSGVGNDSDHRSLDKVDLLPNFDIDSDEYETKTITSALKNYLRHLAEPIMTFKLYNSFISAAKLENRVLRIDKIHQLVHRLPSINFKILKILIEHLQKVAKLHDKNLMTSSNLGVCFGPTLLRTAEESVAAILDIKFVNVIAELLIENYEKFFLTKPTIIQEELTTSNHQNQTQENVNYMKINNYINSQIQQRPLPNIPSQIQTNQQFVTSKMAANNFVRNISSPQSAIFSTHGNRFFSLLNNNVRRSNSQDQLYTAIQSRSRAIYSSDNNNDITATTTGIPMLHPQHSKQNSSNYSTYSHYQLQQKPTNVSRQALHLSLSSASPSPSLSSTISTIANNQHQNSALYQSHQQMFYKPITSNSLYSPLRITSNQLLQPSVSYQNLHYNSDMSCHASDLLKKSPTSHQSNSNLIHNRPMTSIGIMPPNSTYATLIRSDNNENSNKVVEQSKITYANMTTANNNKVTNYIPSPNASSLTTRPVNLSSSSSASLPSTPENSQSQFTYKLPVSNVIKQTIPTLSRNQINQTSPSANDPMNEMYSSNLHHSTTKNSQSIYGSVGSHRPSSVKQQSSLPSRTVRTRYVCIGGSESELSFQPNMIITNVRISREPGWLEGNLNGKTGLIPLNYVEFIE